MNDKDIKTALEKITNKVILRTENLIKNESLKRIIEEEVRKCQEEDGLMKKKSF